MDFKFSTMQKGLLYMAAGLVLFLHTLGIIRVGLNYIIIGIAIYVFFLGFFMADVPNLVSGWLKKKDNIE